MKTEIYIKEEGGEYRLIKVYSIIITMNEGDMIEHEDIEYVVDSCSLHIDINTIQIIVK